MSSHGSDHEQELVRQSVEGSRAAFTALVEPHIGRLLTLATRMLGSQPQGEDAVQDGLASVWVARHRLDPERPVGPYLTTVVLNKCRDRLRTRKAKRYFGLVSADDAALVADESPDPENRAAARQELSLLRAEIERLPVRLREALVLVSIDGRSQAEAASLLGVSEKAIETRVYRARQRLREKFEKF
ncbi:MAG: RNA polymerase sigma factor [Erythrobacter sp.]|uniref:RNA polymerase n=2 Tax=Sphingomonadales TaxID=204457 RepID=A0A0N7GSN8_SPHMC|nr:MULTISPECIES: RNA polymerase sigma factor [Sphingomonadales]KEO86821.1 RNA polymerase [Erythrobacter sp. JL475]MBX7541860.1 RNA polymerase sigma factor [Qipengyuania sphaerica]MCK0099576.1 RNA polymerase sigma factor [Qipengyuania sp. S6317L1]ALH81235.1 RNA polymerase [Sphingopyxis macrogoltabida]MBO6769048.1 RNA polymerase sigma factor [Erythrobacter sp.]